MKKGILGAALLIAAAVPAADVATDVATGAYVAPAAPYTDAILELRWDTGTASWSHCSYTGSGQWVGVDFSIATLTAYRDIASMRMYCRISWPNAIWEGGREAVFAFAGGTPGSMLWGPTWIRATANGFNNFAVGWVLPAGETAFVLAWEQYYNYPVCDPYSVDNNAVPAGHSWTCYGGSWSRLSHTHGYNNLMIRALVNNEIIGVAPASLGRLKAVYY